MILGISVPSSFKSDNINNHDNISGIQTNSTTINQPHETSDNNLLSQQPEDTNRKTETTNGDILTFLTNQGGPEDLRNVLSSSKANKIKNKTNSNEDSDRKINIGILYQVSKINTRSKGSLIDRGANGGLAGSDVRIICKHDPPRYIDVSGLNNHQVKDLEIVTAGGVAPSQRGPVIIILHQYALLGKGNTIHYCIQLESYKNIVDDKTIHHKGSQTITTNDGYIHPLDFVNGLPYLPLRPYTDEEWVTLPHVVWTSDKNWDPTSVDHKLTTNEGWGDSQADQPENNSEKSFNELGDYIMSCQCDSHPILDINKTNVILGRHHNINKIDGKTKPPDYNILKPYFLYVDNETI